LARPREPGRATRPLRPVRARVDAGRAQHASGRRAAAGLRDLSPAPPDLRPPASGLRARPRLRQRRARAPSRRDRGGVPGCRRAARSPSVPRLVGRGAEPRHPAGHGARARPARGGGALRGGGGRLRVDPDRGARGVAQMMPPRLETLPDARVPSGPIAERWERRLAELALVGPVRRRRHEVLVIGTGLAGASAAATLSELGYRVRCLTFHDSPRRAHSVAAQGGINAAKNYANDGDSVERLFHDTLEGGDFRSRESNVYRLAEISVRIIDHLVAQGVPFAREYGGHLAARS